MYIENGVAYASAPVNEKRIISLKMLDVLYMLVTFANGEERIFDATVLLKYPVYEPLRDNAVFSTATVSHGMITWLDGELDIAPEAVYEHSYAYDRLAS